MIHPRITPEIFALRPDFAALSLTVTGARTGPADHAGAGELAEATEMAGDAPWAGAHLEAWREAYRAFGARPNRTPCSAEALRRRVLRDGRLRPVNAVVDLYNAVSLRFALPVGGEDLRRYAGPPTLRRAMGSEPFDTMADGAPRTEYAEPGEVVWCDDAGITCRRWNWRQGVRTQITDASSDMWFVLERLEPMPPGALVDAGRALLSGLRRLGPSLTASALLFDKANPRGAAQDLAPRGQAPCGEP